MKLGPLNELVPLQPAETTWWGLHVTSPALTNSQFVKKLRKRFRMLHWKCEEILECVKQSELFDQWKRQDATGGQASPLQLLVLGSLRHIGRGRLAGDSLRQLAATTCKERFVVTQS